MELRGDSGVSLRSLTSVIQSIDYTYGPDELQTAMQKLREARQHVGTISLLFIVNTEVRINAAVYTHVFEIEPLDGAALMHLPYLFPSVMRSDSSDDGAGSTP